MYELYGLDFMLDEDMQLWFIECNPNPLLDGVKPELITRMLMDLYEIQFAYYRSRMTRVLDVIKKMQKEMVTKKNVDYEKWRKQYQVAVQNKIEPAYKISKANTWEVIMDESQPISKAYFGHIPAECAQIQGTR